MKIHRLNVRSVYVAAMVAGDEETLELIYAYLRNEGWAGGISVEEAIDAVERDD